MKFGMSCGIKPKMKYVCISMKEIGRNLNGPLQGKKRAYVMFWNFSRFR